MTVGPSSPGLLNFSNLRTRDLDLENDSYNYDSYELVGKTIPTVPKLLISCHFGPLCANFFNCIPNIYLDFMWSFDLLMFCSKFFIIKKVLKFFCSLILVVDPTQVIEKMVIR